jgi:hypothetical protein
LCLLAQSLRLSGLLLGGTSIGLLNFLPIFFLNFFEGFACHLRLIFAGCAQKFYLICATLMHVGTISLTDALFCISQDLLRLELSNCGLTAPDFAQICINLSRINTLDLNFGGNSIKLEI